MLQEKANINIIQQETITDEQGIKYTINGLRKVQVFGDAITNKESTNGIMQGDIITIMQVSQPEIYHIYLEEFGATTDGFNLFTFKNINKSKDFLVFRNGIKLEKDSYYVNNDGKLVVSACNGPTIAELSINAKAKGDLISVYQFFTKDAIAVDDLTMTEEILTATKTGAEYFQLKNTTNN